MSTARGDGAARRRKLSRPLPSLLGGRECSVLIRKEKLHSSRFFKSESDAAGKITSLDS